MAGPEEAESKKTTVSIPAALEADRKLFLERLAKATESSSEPRAFPGAPLSATALNLLDRYAVLLYEKIPTLALVAKSDRSQLYTRHILDSLNALSLFTEPPEYILDIGSGGGFPGLPLGIVWPRTRAVLLESRERKGAFLEQTVRRLGVRNIKVAVERLEEHSRKKEPAYDVVFVRAVAEVVRLIEMIAPSCVPGARWVYFAGGGIDREQLRRELAATGRTCEEATGAFGGRLVHGLV